MKEGVKPANKNEAPHAKEEQVDFTEGMEVISSLKELDCRGGERVLSREEYQTAKELSTQLKKIVVEWANDPRKPMSVLAEAGLYHPELQLRREAAIAAANDKERPSEQQAV